MDQLPTKDRLLQELLHHQQPTPTRDVVDRIPNTTIEVGTYRQRETKTERYKAEDVVVDVKVCHTIIMESLPSASRSTSVEKAAQALKNADYLLILAGAGFSADSGLATYETMPEEYRELCDPLLLIQQPSRFQQFWIEFATKYASCQPHGGYEILDNWCHGGTLDGLSTTTKDGGSASSSSLSAAAWWVYTSNVDGHFRRYPSFETHVCEIHGFAGEFRCACAMGRLEGRNGRRQGIDWDQWNDQVDPVVTEKCDSSVIAISERQETFISCDHCGCLARPNVLLFHDTDENVLEAIQHQRDRYQSWEAQMEEDVVLDGKRLVIVEFGCGMNVPAVRIEAEEVLADCLDRIQSQAGDDQDHEGGRVTLVRVNPKDAGIENEQLRDHVISIFDTSLNVLQSIDQALRAS
jgi:NAD-dependent SIR2 family protein deacetylase